jgi:molybdopterin-biosynthesis enzyme MoeA-like protein
MNFGALIIGDEILSGRRSDKHLARLIELLAARGLKLSWARYAGDDFVRLTETLRQTFATGDVVFSFGGIGATPDDRTREAAGAALGLELALHPAAEAEIRARFGEWVLDTRYTHLHHAEDYVEQAVTVWDAYEGQLIGLMRQVTADFPDATLFSLPTIAGEGQRRSLELGMKGALARVQAAMTVIKTDLSARGLEWEDKV